jgi:hypothetical protein
MILDDSRLPQVKIVLLVARHDDDDLVVAFGVGRYGGLGRQEFDDGLAVRPRPSSSGLGEAVIWTRFLPGVRPVILYWPARISLPLVALTSPTGKNVT